MAGDVCRLDEGAERLHHVAVDRELAAEHAADARAFGAAAVALAAHRVVGPRIELDRRRELGVLDRPLRQLPAKDGGAVRPRRKHRLVVAERCRAGVQGCQLAGGDVDDPAARSQTDRLTRREQILVERERRHSASRSDTQADVLDLEAVLDAVLRALAADARLLDAAERRHLGRDQARC